MDMQKAYIALKNADAAGDVDAARQIAAYIKSSQSSNAPPVANESTVVQESQRPVAEENSSGFMQTLGNIGAGALRGAGSIGATILSPLDAAARAVGIQNNVIGRTDRREAMDQALRGLGADTDSLAYGAGKIGAEIAGTAGAGGVLAKGLGAAIPAISRIAPSAAAKAPALVEALRTGGMAGGNLATRAAGGAATGAAAGGMIDPSEALTGAAIGAALPVAGRAISAAGQGAKRALGSTTGVGDEAISQAFQAGKQGGTRGEAFAKALRGEGGMDDVLVAAKENLADMGRQKQEAYRTGMANVKADKSVLSFDGINDAVKRAAEMASFKGQAKNPKAAQAVNEVAETVDEWMRLSPQEFHTPEGLDALKQRVGAIMEGIPFEQSTSRKAVGDIYSSIKSEISKQAPEYSKVMRDYSEASELIGEIEKSLSLGKRANADTAMRKLQSLMRNNVNTSYGYRDELARQLSDAGGREILPALAGQAMSEWTPRGIQRATSALGAGGLAMTGNIPAAAGMAAISSPRLIGEGAYALGKASGAVNPAIVQALRRGMYTAAPVVGVQ